MRKYLAVALVGGLLFMGLPANAGKPVTVWEDDSGDADNNQGLGQSIPGGFDLTGGSIAKVGSNLEFTVTHADMPAFGSLPETFRFLWAFSVDGVTYRLTVKRADVGKPDVVQGQTTERVGRIDAEGHFRLEGECSTTAAPAVLSFINCKPLAYLEGTWDATAKTFTMVVPMEAVGAKVGSKIGPGAGDATAICAASACWVSHAAERSNGSTVIDTANQIKIYKVPKK